MTKLEGRRTDNRPGLMDLCEGERNQPLAFPANGGHQQSSRRDDNMAVLTRRLSRLASGSSRAALELHATVKGDDVIL